MLDSDHEAIAQSVKKCLSIPFLGLAVDDTTLYIKLSARTETSLEELIAVTSIAESFGLENVLIRRRDVVFTMNTRDMTLLIQGQITPDEFLDRIDVRADNIKPSSR